MPKLLIASGDGPKYQEILAREAPELEVKMRREADGIGAPAVDGKKRLPLGGSGQPAELRRRQPGDLGARAADEDRPVPGRRKLDPRTPGRLELQLLGLRGAPRREAERRRDEDPCAATQARGSEGSEAP